MKNLNFEIKSKSDVVQSTFFSWPIRMIHKSNFTCLSLPFVKMFSPGLSLGFSCIGLVIQ